MWGAHLCAIFSGCSFGCEAGRERAAKRFIQVILSARWMWLISGTSCPPADIFSWLNLYRRVNRWLRDCLCSSNERPGFVNILPEPAWQYVLDDFYSWLVVYLVFAWWLCPVFSRCWLMSTPNATPTRNIFFFFKTKKKKKLQAFFSSA